MFQNRKILLRPKQIISVQLEIDHPLDQYPYGWDYIVTMELEPILVVVVMLTNTVVLQGY